MFKKFIYWLLKRHIRIIQVRTSISKLTEITMENPERFRNIIFMEMARKIADELAETGMVIFTRKEYLDKIVFEAEVKIVK